MVARARDGDTHAFEGIVRRYQRPIYRLAARMLYDTGEAEDVTQEVFVTAWRRTLTCRTTATPSSRTVSSPRNSSPRTSCPATADPATRFRRKTTRRSPR